LSKNKTFATHFSFFSSTPVCCGKQFGKHCSRPHPAHTKIYPHHIGMRSQMFYIPTGRLKSDKWECLWSSVEHTAQAVTCCRKNSLS